MAHDALEARISSMLADIDVDVDSHALEACHRFGKPERTTKSRKNIVRFTIGCTARNLYLTVKKLLTLAMKNSK